jgi:hypothetical protein
MSRIEEIPGFTAEAFANCFNLDLPPPEWETELGSDIAAMYERWALRLSYTVLAVNRALSLREVIGFKGLSLLSQAPENQNALLGPCVFPNGTLIENGIGFWTPTKRPELIL